MLLGVYLSLCLRGMSLSGWSKILISPSWLYSYMHVLLLPGSILLSTIGDRLCEGV